MEAKLINHRKQETVALSGLPGISFFNKANYPDTLYRVLWVDQNSLSAEALKLHAGKRQAVDVMTGEVVLMNDDTPTIPVNKITIEVHE